MRKINEGIHFGQPEVDKCYSELIDLAFDKVQKNNGKELSDEEWKAFKPMLLKKYSKEIVDFCYGKAEESEYLESKPFKRNISVKALNEKLERILNETKKDELKVGDIVYLRGDYGLYDDKYEIIKITDSHDEAIKEVKSGTYLFQPDRATTEPIALLKNVETGETQAWKMNPGRSYENDPIELAADIDAIKATLSDLNATADSLKDALKQNGIDTNLQITSSEEKGKAFPKFYIKGETNLVDQAGIWKYAVKEMVLDSFGSGFVDNNSKIVYFNLHFSYKHIDGGTNGCDIGSAILNLTDKTWTVRLGE